MKTSRLRRQLDDPMLATTHPVYRPLLWVVMSVVLLAVAWAALAELDETTRGEGRVVPFSRTQKIQSLEGGILKDLMVKEGDLVEAGQQLLRLDNTHFLTSFQESANHAKALQATIARLDAEVLEKKEIDFPHTIDPRGPLARSENELFRSRRDKLLENTQAIAQQIQLAKQQLNLIRPLVTKHAVSQMEALRLSQDITTLQGKLSELKNTYSQDAYTERSQRKAELSALEPIVLQRRDQLQRTDITSPVRGRVNTILINTRGGVIQPGEPIMEITPVEDTLLIEARIKPRDVAFLVPGMPARVKITAYDYSIYGDLQGTLEQISADTIEEDTAHGKESFYQVLIKTDANQLKRGDKILPIIPGMVAEVDIISGKRSVLNYLLRPLIKARLY
ncbi:HlyD family efflux transporter periplasmic adaptor subunit [Enterobacter bugandensis]|uniref:HlyD family efflux transporter periplasmic adaptor subunit n=1 Tax=Enterobacter bugandensis TaxID=881260 RepID=UPI00207626A9|nr:HlyD family efflux transporter periplasmic adaptor subunit [Enterobacter bugandensis]MCM7239189.1 HlyD family efflux transporter periplasmic adaptor subunit [Enterobacter bugandensis]MCM7319113.1 HlyD family efflux transporter periplasmic adaptor subunit [Enterobacter bugandensis]MCM7354560.1 HlyD family efflux transporter periplasmic adaptor subunit [Enterobacter bugandensis]